MRGTAPPRRARLRLGAHMSIAGGLPRAVDRALSVGAGALQIFTQSSRQWTARPLGAQAIRTFRERLEATDLRPHTLVHAGYLINLAGPEGALRERSLWAAAAEIERCALLGLGFLVVHPGSHRGAGEAAGLARVIEALDLLLRGDRDGPMLLLETTAGQGTSLGHRFEQIGHVLDRVSRPERVGVCFDTCHAFAAGYDFRDARGYRRTFDAFDAQVGLSRLRAFHLNDSRHELGSRLDRHAHIGQGQVGRAGFRRLLGDPRFAGLPMVLETPKGDDLAEDRRNLALLRSLVPRGR